jgi:hypothetical protein
LCAGLPRPKPLEVAMENDVQQGGQGAQKPEVGISLKSS